MLARDWTLGFFDVHVSTYVCISLSRRYIPLFSLRLKGPYAPKVFLSWLVYDTFEVVESPSLL